MVLKLSSENVAQKSYDPAHLPVATVLLFLQLLQKGFCLFCFVFFSLSQGLPFIFRRNSWYTLAESNSPGCFPYLCSISSSARAGKFKCSVTLTPWRLSLYRQSDPPTKILLPREDLTHFPINKRVFRSVAGDRKHFFFSPNWKE